MHKLYVIFLAGMLSVMLIASGCTSPSPAGTTTSVPTTTAPVETTPIMTTPTVPSWAGTWNTTWLNTDGNETVSVVTLTVAGQEASGNYSYTYPDEGTFTGHLNGTVKGQTLTGMYAESDEDVGYFIFELSIDGNSFTGRWVHAENQSELHNSTLFWDGVRVTL